MLCFLKLIAYSRPFGEGGWGIFPPNVVNYRSNPQKEHPCAEIRHKAWKLVQRFDLQGAGSRRKGKDRTGQSKKARSCKISPIWGEAPTVPIETKICMAGNLADVITYAKFQDNVFRGMILQGVEFPIFLLIFAWALQQCSANCATCDQALSLIHISEPTRPY